MSPIGWTDALYLAYEPMDRVHREFIALLAVAERAGDADLVGAWGAVVDHTAAHFADEDRWMRETRFAGAELALHMRRQPEPRRRTRAPGKTVGGPTR